jgi:hypothetical protein
MFNFGSFVKKAAGTALSTAINASPLSAVVSGDVIANAALGLAKEQDTSETSIISEVVGFVTDVIQLGTIVKMARADGKVTPIETAIILDAVEELVESGKRILGKFRG